MALDLVTFQETFSSLMTIPSSSRIAIAVSGGPDSMVLCHLLGQMFPDITALIVDHGLRPESTTEAHLTQNRLNEFNIPSQILTWSGNKPSSRIQESARQARHSLLQDWCHQHGVLYLFTAHHLDDQWETLYMRHRQSSGHRGMQGILPLSFRPFGALIRPLLSYRKSEILDYARVNDIPYVNDPSNIKPTYERGYIRLNRTEIDQHFPQSNIERIIASAINNQCLVNRDVSRFIQHYVKIHPYGFITITHDAFFQLSHPAKYDLIQRICQNTTDYPYPMPKTKIDYLTAKLEQRKRSTLGGWLFSPRQQTILISREQRSRKDLIYVDHKPIDPINLPSYVGYPKPNHWVKFKHALT